MSKKLVDFQRENRKSTHDRVVAAMREIEVMLDTEEGVRRNVKIIDVVRKAGIGSSTLRNPHHESLRGIVDAWIKRINASQKMPRARSASKKTVAEYEKALRKLNSQAIVWRSEMIEAQRTVSRLKAEVDELQLLLDKERHQRSNTILSIAEIHEDR